MTSLLRRGSLAAARPSQSAFVTRDAVTGNLMLNGQRFRFSGANVGNDIGLVSTSNGNAYGGTAVSGYYLTTHAQIDAALNAAVNMNATVIRVLAAISGNYGAPTSITFQPTVGSFNDAALEPLDYALQQCAIRGIKLVIPFVSMTNSMPWLVSNTGGGSNSNFYTRTATINAYKALIARVLDHVNVYDGIALRDHSAVLCWETGNELVATGVADADFRAWDVAISTYIKTTKGAQQLLMAGQYGIWNDNTYLSNPLTDIYNDHTYDNTRTPSYLANEASIAHAHGKAFVVGEYTWTGSGTGGTLSWFTDQLLATAETSSIDGDLFWDLLAPSSSWSDGYTLHYPGDTDFMKSRVDMLSDHAKRMSNIAAGTFLTDTFTGTNGAALTARTGEVGAVWALQDGWTGVANIQNNRLYTTSSETHYYASGVPATNDYEVTATIFVVSALTNSFAGPMVRCYTTTDYSYQAYVWKSSTSYGVYLDYNNTSGYTNLASASITTPAVGSSHTLKLKVEGSALSVYWDGALKIGPITHTTLPAGGRAGVILGVGSSTTGLHIDSITAATL